MSERPAPAPVLAYHPTTPRRWRRWLLVAAVITTGITLLTAASWFALGVTAERARARAASDAAEAAAVAAELRARQAAATTRTSGDVPATPPADR